MFWIFHSPQSACRRDRTGQGLQKQQRRGAPAAATAGEEVPGHFLLLQVSPRTALVKHSFTSRRPNMCFQKL